MASTRGEFLVVDVAGISTILIMRPNLTRKQLSDKKLVKMAIEYLQREIDEWDEYKKYK